MTYRYSQQPAQPPHGGTSRRGIGPMVSGQHPQNSLTPAQFQAQQQAQVQAGDRAKLRSRKPTDKTLPEDAEDVIIGDGVQRYRDLRDVERRLDATMTKKRFDIKQAVDRNTKRYRTLRIAISNTVEEQPWQADNFDENGFDFNINSGAAFQVKIEGQLLDDPYEDVDSEDSEDDDEAAVDVDAMDEDGKEKTKKREPLSNLYKFSHFIKAMSVDFDRSRYKDTDVEWKKPAVAPNTPPPIAADFDRLQFKRGGDDNVNITVNLTLDETPERCQMSPLLAELLDTDIATRDEAVLGVWRYVLAMGLEDDEEKRSFDCDDLLKSILQTEKGYLPYVADAIAPHISALPPIKLPYTIHVDKAFHDNPQPTIYDIRVAIEDPLNIALASYLKDPAYAADLRKISELNDHLSLLVQKTANSKAKHSFFDALSKNPTEILQKWLSSQQRDIEVIAGDAMRGGGEDARGDEFRKGGKNSIWGSRDIRDVVNTMYSPKSAAEPSAQLRRGP